jgi:hypothetical protein
MVTFSVVDPDLVGLATFSADTDPDRHPTKACRSESVPIRTKSKAILYIFQKNCYYSVQNIENFTSYDSHEKEKQCKLVLL